jgi:hypothetical protein
MIQPGPDTRLEDWDGSSGYHSRDNRILGLSHPRDVGLHAHARQPSWFFAAEILIEPPIR